MRARNAIGLLACTSVLVWVGGCGGSTTVVNKPPAEPEPTERTTTTTTTTTTEPAERPAPVEVEKKTEIEVDD
jgi:hypothetical protein